MKIPLLLTAVVTALLAVQSPAASRSILVLDASGSMWGDVKGEAKIVVAKRVIGELVAGLPDGTEMGLLTYGHRRKGDCEDIELLIPPGVIDKAAFTKAVEAVSPKGMTPLTDAMEMAAEMLKLEEGPASVILVTDGLETCDRDPCEAALKLEALGIDFTAHVVAFDLSQEDAQKIRCIADATGGQFLPAQDAESLKSALEITVEPPAPAPEPETVAAPPAPPEAMLTVPAEVPAGSEFSVEWSGPDDKGDYLTVVPADAEDRVYKNFAYTRQGSPSTLTAMVKPQSVEVRYIHGVTRKVLGRAPTTITEVLATLDAAEEVVAGASVKVTWTGPANKGDFISIVPADAEEGEYSTVAYARDESEPAAVLAPIKPGSCEIRYITGQGRKTLAARAINVVGADVTLDAIDEVVAGGSVKVTWTGPANKGDFITIIAADAEEGKYGAVGYATDPDEPAKVVAPIKPGPCEVRYISGQGRKTLAARAINVVGADVTLDAADEVVAGASVKVTWTGPANKGDFITIIAADAEEGKYGAVGYASDPDEPARVVAPIKPGPCEVRYISGQGRKTLAARAINVVGADVTLDAAGEVVAGASVKVTWTGPANKGDFITIIAADAEEGKYGKVAYASDPDEPAKVVAPIEAGPCEVRYISGLGRKTLAARPVAVVAATVTLDAPDEAEADTKVKITWSGPANQGDFITIVPAETPEGKYGKVAYAKEPDDPATVPAPEKAGSYEIRYISGQGRKTLASRPLTITVREDEE